MIDFINFLMFLIFPSIFFLVKIKNNFGLKVLSNIIFIKFKGFNNYTFLF